MKCTVLPKPVSCTIEIKVPANQQIIQEIPIVNNDLNKDWTVKAIFKKDGKNSNWFSGS